jgi:hypothetical protein
VVAACKPCNLKKGSKLLSEMPKGLQVNGKSCDKWELEKKPETPMVTNFYWLAIAERTPEWQPYLSHLEVATA